MHRETRLTLYGRGPAPGPANPPIMRASTILHDSVETWKDAKKKRETDDHVLSYGRRGTTTAHALCDALCDLENGDSCFLYPSGVAALSAAIAAHVKTGDHLLVVDEAFHATRHFCENYLRHMGVRTDYFPWDTTQLDEYVKPETKAILVESPTSKTFKAMDLPTLCNSAKKFGLTVIADNTYGSGWLYQPLSLGCDVSVISGTKYLSGHADTMMGAVVATTEASDRIRNHTHLTGQTLSPDDAYACLRGMRTLALRMERHGENARAIAHWIKERGDVDRVWHPDLPQNPGHEIWQRDASGTNGLLSFRFHKRVDIPRFIEKLRLFSVGTSWGGFESLILPLVPAAGQDGDDGPNVRLHIGIENLGDLLADLEQALD